MMSLFPGSSSRGGQRFSAGGYSPTLRCGSCSGEDQVTEARTQARRSASLGARESAGGRRLGGQRLLDRGGEGGTHFTRHRGRLGCQRRPLRIQVPAASRRPRQHRVCPRQ